MAKKTNVHESTKFKVSKNANCFAFVKDEDDKVVIVLGGYAASSKRFDNFEQAESYLSTKPWELIISVCGILQTRFNNEQKIKNAEKATNKDA